MQKKNLIKKACMVVFAAAIAFSPMQVQAKEAGYTYNYDYWGDVQDSTDFYSVSKVFTSSDLGLDVKLKNPQGMFVIGNSIYLCDSGNNRIIELNRISPEKLEVVRIIDSFKGKNDNTKFNNPTDVAIAENGDIFVADQGNARVLKLDKDLNYLMEFVKPDDNTLDKKLVFQPNKIVIDTAERMYCIAKGINKGLVKYESDGTFAGFVGATPVTYNWTDYIWKKFASQAQRAKMESFVPTEYENIFMDTKGFIYATTAVKVEDGATKPSSDAVRKLNLMGNNILVQNGDWDVCGDLYVGSGGGYEGPSLFTDVTVLDNDIYACLDRNRGRVFGYDEQGKLVFAFGGNGNMNGYFRQPSAIEHIGRELYVVDSLDCSITSFVPTKFGETVYKAIDTFDEGKYDESGDAWREVMKQNGNYDLAYIGIGRTLLRQKNYKEAMRYFELKYDTDNYSKAFKQYRKEWVESHIAIIVIVLLALFLVPMTIGKYKKIKYEIEADELFKRELKGR